MTQNDHNKRVEAWLERVRYDFDTAKAMYQTGRYLYVIFMGQQAIEKVLKAAIEARGEEAPFEHNLRKLINTADLHKDVPEEWWPKIDFLSQYYLNARYKEDIPVLSKKITQEVAEEFFGFTKEMIEWCTQKINSMK